MHWTKHEQNRPGLPLVREKSGNFEKKSGTFRILKKVTENLEFSKKSGKFGIKKKSG